MGKAGLKAASLHRSHPVTTSMSQGWKYKHGTETSMRKQGQKKGNLAQSAARASELDTLRRVQQIAILIFAAWPLVLYL